MLVIGALGSAIGLPAALVMILPDVGPLPPESLVEFLLWLWLCVTLGLSVNLGVQLLLSPGDPLTLLQRELDERLRLVEDVLRELSGASDVSPASPRTSLDSVVAAGMSRPLALLKSASIVNPRARQSHEMLATTITLVDRLVTDAAALRLLVSSPGSSAPSRASLLRVADACARSRRTLADNRPPVTAEPEAPPQLAAPSEATPPPLADMERTLEQLAVVARLEPRAQLPRSAGHTSCCPTP